MTTNFVDPRTTKRGKKEQLVCAIDEKLHENILSIIFSSITEPRDWNAVLQTSKSWYELGKKYLDFSSYDHWALYQACRHGTATAVEYIIDNPLFNNRPVTLDLCKRFPYPILAGANSAHGVEIFKVLYEKRPDFLSVLHESLNIRELPIIMNMLPICAQVMNNIKKE